MSLPETPPLLQTTVTTMSRTHDFVVVGSVGGGFGGGDRQTELSSNDDNIVFDIGDN